MEKHYLTDKSTEQAPDFLTQAALQYLNLSYLFPYQRLVISNILDAHESEEMRTRDLEQISDQAYQKQIVLLPTGAGKSVCFQLPSILCNRPTLIIYPLLGLMNDQERRFKTLGIKTVVLRGGQNKETREDAVRRIQKEPSVIILSNPETCIQPAIRKLLHEAKIVHLVVDEAHCLPEWGESFRPAYLDFAEMIQNMEVPVVSAFTATASDTIIEKIQHYLFGEEHSHVIKGNPDRPNISYSAVPSLAKDDTVHRLLAPHRDTRCSELILPPLKKPAIVFCRSRVSAEKTAHYLRRRDPQLNVGYYHAGLEKQEKKNIEDWFMESNDAVLTATCAYGLGMDKSNVRTVIHRDLSPNVEAFLQESGRGGRNGGPSQSITVYSPIDLALLPNGVQAKQRYLQMLNYLLTNHCRRSYLLELLNYSLDGCSGCDVCDKNVQYRPLHSSWISPLLKHFSGRHSESFWTESLCAGSVSMQKNIDFGNGSFSVNFPELLVTDTENLLKSLKFIGGLRQQNHTVTGTIGKALKWFFPAPNFLRWNKNFDFHSDDTWRNAFENCLRKQF